jgi:hypothetical protein
MCGFQQTKYACNCLGAVRRIVALCTVKGSKNGKCAAPRTAANVADPNKCSTCKLEDAVIDYNGAQGKGAKGAKGAKVASRRGH